MYRILDIAKFLEEEYLLRTSENMGEMKMHKLLYFANRDALALFNEPLFNEPMLGWIHDPVSLDVRIMFYKEKKENCHFKEIDEEAQKFLRMILEEYGSISSWSLRELSHKEEAWQKSRAGLAEGEHGNKELNLEDIRADALKLKRSEGLKAIHEKLKKY